MTIEKGSDWGSRGRLAEGSPIASSDLGIVEAYLDGASEVGLIGGDLARTMSAHASSNDLRTGSNRARLPIDLGEIVTEGRTFVFAAHAVLRRRSWRGNVVALMNASFLGDWNPAPRAHPNDGRLDIVSSTLRGGEKWEARRRLPSGTHVPHPEIDIRRRSDGDLVADPGASLWIDGRRIGPCAGLSFRVLADAITIVI